jgi:hypothetical protein
MDNIITFLWSMFRVAKKFTKNGLLYEAAYKYGQIAAMLNLIYMQHADSIIALSDEQQAQLARARQTAELMVESLSQISGNGHGTLSGKHSPRHALKAVLEMLKEDIFTGWM